MPELPEVEIVRRGLAPVMVERRIARVDQRRPDLRFALPDRFAARLEGATFQSLGRRAKYLIAHVSTGDVLIMHLGMSGRFTVGDGALADRSDTLAPFVYGAGADPKHDHVVLHMEGGAIVTYNDPRRFGFMLLVPSADLDRHPLFRALGPEPLGPDLTPAGLAARAAGRSSDLKAFLLDQRTIAGLGNIYVSEALFRAGLSPHREAASLATRRGLPADRCLRLVPAIRAVLTDAIGAGGSTLRNYRQADGAAGGFQERFSVYGRAGEPCVREGCTGNVRRVVQAARATYVCPRCQR